MRKIILSLVALLGLAAPLAVTAASPASAATGPQRQAIGSAQDYLRAMPFSKQGLIDQLPRRTARGSASRSLPTR